MKQLGGERGGRGGKSREGGLGEQREKGGKSGGKRSSEALREGGMNTRMGARRRRKFKEKVCERKMWKRKRGKMMMEPDKTRGK
jgi:hypothetical protein